MKMLSRFNHPSTFVLLGSVVLSTWIWSAEAATLYWDGGISTPNGQSDNTTTAGENWLSDGNWDNGAGSSTPLASWNTGDSAVFGGTAASQTVTAGTLTVGDITFGQGPLGAGTSGTAYTVTGGTITLGAPSTVTTNTDTTISSVLAGAGSSLTKAGAGTLTLTGTNTYSGATTVGTGTLNVGGGGTTGTLGSGAVTSNAQLTVARSNAFNLSTIASNAAGIGGTGNVTLSSAAAITFDRSIVLAGVSSAITATSTSGPSTNSFIFSGASIIAPTVSVTGSARMVFSGSTTNIIGQAGGTATLSGVDNGYYGAYGGNNATVLDTRGNVTITGTYTGGNTIYGGMGLGGTLKNTGGLLKLVADASASSGRVGFENGVTGSYVGSLKLSGNIEIDGTAGSTFAATYRDIVLGNVSSIAASTLTLNGQKNGIALNGSFTETAGQLNVIMNNNGANGTSSISGTINGTAITGSLTMSSVNTINLAGTMSASGGISVTCAAASSLTGAIGGTGGFSKAGAGALTLSAANTYTGVTTVNAGTLALSGNGAISNSSKIELGGAGTAFDVSAVTPATWTLGAAQTLQGTGTLAAGAKSVTLSGFVRPGDTVAGGSGISTLTISGTGGTKALQGNYLFDVNYTALTGDLIDITGGAGTTVDTTGLFKLNSAAGSVAPGTHYAIKLFQWNAADTLGSGIVADGADYTNTNGLAAGQSIIRWGDAYYLVPEPASFVLLGLGGLLLLRRPSRRRGRAA